MSQQIKPKNLVPAVGLALFAYYYFQIPILNAGVVFIACGLVLTVADLFLPTPIPWVVISALGIDGILSFIWDVFLLKDKAYYARDSFFIIIAIAVISITITAVAFAIWKAIPDTVKEDTKEKAQAAAKKMRKPSNIPGMREFLNEKNKLRNSLISDYNASITFTDGTDPLIQDISTEFIEANTAFTEAYEEIQYVSKGKMLDQYAGIINSALNTMVKNVKQLTIYIEHGGNRAANQNNQTFQNQGQYQQQYNNQNGEDAANQDFGNQDNATEDSGGSFGFDFFAGCQSEADLKKRYRDLMKSFHPDGDIGDEDSVKQINEAYEKAQKKFAE